MAAAENLVPMSPPEADLQPLILLVDDHHVTAEIERSYFGSVGFRVVLATNSQDVERIVREQDVDLIMIDVSFARDQGLKLVSHIKKQARNAHLKIIVTSVVGLPALRKNAEDAGADQFLTKPAPRPKILREIKRLTDQKARGGERVKQELHIQYSFENKNEAALTLDLSIDGVHLAHFGKSLQNKYPSVGSSISLTLDLDPKEKPLVVTGQVVRHTQEGFGVKFDELSKNSRRILDKYTLKFSMEHRASQFYL